MIDFGTEGNAALEGDNVRLAVVFYIAADPIARAWTGVGDLTLPSDNVDTTGGTYKGVGEMSGLPALNQMINGQAQAVEFTISGVGIDALGMQLLTAGAEDVRWARMNIGIVLFDEFQQRIGDTVWIWEGECSTVEGSNEAGDDGAVRTVSLGVGSTFTGRRRPRVVNFTDAHQRRISADDRFFDRIASYTAGTTIPWP